jgi:hypothetical protein
MILSIPFTEARKPPFIPMKCPFSKKRKQEWKD